MILQTTYMHRGAITQRVRSQLRSIVPRTLVATASYVGASKLPNSTNTHSFSTLTRTTSCRHYSKCAQAPVLIDRVTPKWMNAKQQFSTAAATKYSADDEIYDDRKSQRTMPRLQALRERLQVEKQDLQPSVNSLDNMSQALEEPMIDYSNSITNENILTDTHGRHHNYLRISLSERCNLRCQYCMPPEGVPLSPKSHLLTDEEIMRLVHLFVKNGVNKVRLTGGEPLLRPNLASLVGSISNALTMSDNLASDVNHSLVGITTNAMTLSRQIDDLVDAGMTSVNISLDTLRADRYLEITRRNGLDKVMRAIGDTISAFRRKYGDVRVGPNGTGGSRIKINCVVMKGFNDDELSDFVRMSDERFGGDIDMRFIEWMPFNDNGWNTSRFLSYKDMMDKISDEGLPLERIGDGPNDTTKWWRAQTNQDGKSRVGFITSMSEHFCSSCNRLRITADGKIKVCLFSSNEKEVSLRDIMRNHQHEDPKLQQEELGKVIYAAVQKKTEALGGHGNAEGIAKAADNRPMTLIGG
eukprot:CAMPEP_0172313958 /NCGR_PEP_ID=MMETSP1058-20130122/21350_1 /TAXON_ID=83371 /ORGANISM="Detonula confervacea, Strain CCMP 353" /LENGTH=525 /DNA_ID=CAMNT_0013027701 /DNA_START=243 /DNA_END=1820 /DNA_ORIENTATION=-